MFTNNSSSAEGARPEFTGQSGHWQPALPPYITETGLSGIIDDNHNDATVVQPAETALSQEAISSRNAEYTSQDEKMDRPVKDTSLDHQRSFSYYLQDELPDDEDGERLDPAWGIQRVDTAQILSGARRSDSFPDFEPSKSALASPQPDRTIFSPPQSQTDSNPWDRQETPMWVTQEAPDTPSMQHQNPDMPWADDHPETSTVNSQSITEKAEARYDEGVPLMFEEESHDEQVERNEADRIEEDNAFAMTANEPESSFFETLNPATVETHASSALERKSTSDVMRSLGLSNVQGSDSPTEEQPAQNGFSTTSDLEDDFAKAIGIDRPSTGTEDEEAKWKALLGGDEDEFLVEDADDLLPESEPGSPSSFVATLQSESQSSGLKVASSHRENINLDPRDQQHDFGRTQSNHYAPHQPSTAELTQFSPTGKVGLSRPALAPMNSFQSHLQQNIAPSKPTASFVDQAKGGYKSPYDLPMDLSKPKRRAHAPPAQPTTKSIPPPPRSTSLSSPDKQLASPFTPTATTFSAAQPSPSYPFPRSVSAAPKPQSSESVKGASSSFFEELPIKTKPRPASNMGRYTPSQPSPVPPPPLLPRSPSIVQEIITESEPQRAPASDQYSQFQLRPAERVNPYADVANQSLAPVGPQPSASRYSPAPPNAAGAVRPSPSPRYSPAPPPQGPPTGGSRYASQPVPTPSQNPNINANRYASQPVATAPAVNNALPFQPRTSSPLAYQPRNIEQQ